MSSSHKQPNAGGSSAGSNNTQAPSSSSSNSLDAPIDPNDEDANLRRGLDVIQSMIDISAHCLEGLRTTCATSSELTQQEIRTFEGKLVRMFTELLLTRAKLAERLPSGPPPASEAELRQWLRIVGLSHETLAAMLPHCESLERLLEADDARLRALVQMSPQPREEEARRLVRAMGNLRRCRLLLLAGDGSATNAAAVAASVASAEMWWDSWDRPHHHHHHHHHRERGVGSSPRAAHRGAAAGVGGGGGAMSKHKYAQRGVVMAPLVAVGSPQHVQQQQQQHTFRSPQHEQRTTSSTAAQSASQPSAQLAAQFSPPSADVAAATLAAVLANRRQTLSPDELSVGRGTPTSPSPPSSPSTTTTSSGATAPASSTGSTLVGSSTASGRSVSNRFPTTPPPKRKLHAIGGGGVVSPVQQLQQQTNAGVELPAMPKSKSHESKLLQPAGASETSAGATGGASGSSDVYPNNNNPTAGGGGGRPRIHTEPSPDNHNDLHSHQQHSAADNTHTLYVPRSPVTPHGVVVHRGGFGAGQYNSQPGGPHAQLPHGTSAILNAMQTSTSSESSSCCVSMSASHGHRFTKKFKVMSSCDLCGKQMFFGLKCKDCKYRCHKDCEHLVASTCSAHRKSQQMHQADMVFMASHSPNLGVRAAGGALLGGGSGSGTTSGANALRGSAATAGRRDRLRSSDFGGGFHHPGGGGGAGLPTESGGSAGSSCNSSTPSSPAIFLTQQNTPTLAGGGGGGLSSSSSNTATTMSTTSGAGIGLGLTAAGNTTTTGGGGGSKTQFKFPEVPTIYKPDTVGGITLETHLIRQEQQQQQMQARAQQQHKSTQPGSPRTVGGKHQQITIIKSPPEKQPKGESKGHSGGGSKSASTTAKGTLQIPTSKEVTFTNAIDDPTATGNSEASSNTTDSDRTAIRLDSADDPDESDDRIEADGHWSRQNSVSLKEWDIPFEDIVLQEKIGDGRFGTVHRAQWHGAVAIKILKEDYLDNEAFKVEVATFKKTRHENVVLFMGACIKPQAIVTSLCKGNTLYTHVHVRKDKFNLNKTTMVAQQISLGMGYLHARNITHKDLKTKNIFLENGKVIITDFGLFSATKLEYHECHGLRVPYGWLPYLAPEIMQQLQPRPPEHRDALPFSTKSDIYAFGTVWYELLCGEFPFKAQAPEAVIFQVGRGMKQTLANLQAARDVKEILMTCWAFDWNLRPDFSTILQQLEKLPKKRLARSPSHPVQLSRSAESVF